MRPLRDHSWRRRTGLPSSAFTLIEVILAISIATGLLIVAMTFYRQVADLRNLILKESERLATVRLIMDRLASDLHAARIGAVAGQEFRGGSSSLSFVTALTELPTAGGTPGSVQGGADSARITLSTVTAPDGTNAMTVVGLLRESEPVNMVVNSAPERPVLAHFGDGPVESTNRWVEPTTELIRYVHFRYWTGSSWETGWTNSVPPPGVEIVLGLEPPPDDATTDDYPYEQFRRVIHVPAGLPQESAAGDALGAGLAP